MVATLIFKNANSSQNVITLLEQCKSVSQLKQIHAFLIASGLFQHEPFPSKLLLISANFSSSHADYSYRIFCQISYPTIFSWNTITRACANSKNPNRSISIFVKMLNIGVPPDHLTYPFVVKASARLSSIQHGMEVHDHIIKTGYESDRFILNSLIHMYASCGIISCARKVFDEMLDKNLVSWNSMLDGYAKCGDLNAARELFESMPERDVVSWSSLIDGYVKGGKHEQALEIFERMQAVGPKANDVTMVSILCACAHLGVLEQGRSMHQYMIENGLPLNLILLTSLVDMYAKCGAIEEAMLVFRGAPKNRSDVLFWNTIIGALATHGCVQESLDLFAEMQMVGVASDEITYLCVLSACAHGGLVKEAWHFFESLKQPKSEHYACMVNVLARAGQLTEAYEFLNEMPQQPTASMLGALLSGCMNHKRLDIAERVGKKLIELEPHHDGRYVGLSNIYAADKRWDDAKTMREAMEIVGVKKSPGCSSVEISGVLHRFVAHDKTHSMSSEIYRTANLILKQIKRDADYDDQGNFV
ncbi:hypothetical protein Nepgr_014335 [Nepenthes gracilis]|uniref:Pentatricopeptide repeat-containing protein n=1 Tax=Nepenthes gracilis TaxID=150966 RepID=A0AAD3XQ16_NEPGR|nr:hypothetical protein Nepgr_014335 [Nepenthes gracilis]